MPLPDRRIAADAEPSACPITWPPPATRSLRAARVDRVDRVQDQGLPSGTFGSGVPPAWCGIVGQHGRSSRDPCCTPWRRGERHSSDVEFLTRAKSGVIAVRTAADSVGAARAMEDGGQCRGLCHRFGVGRAFGGLLWALGSGQRESRRPAPSDRFATRLITRRARDEASTTTTTTIRRCNAPVHKHHQASRDRGEPELRAGTTVCTRPVTTS